VRTRVEKQVPQRDSSGFAMSGSASQHLYPRSPWRTFTSFRNMPCTIAALAGWRALFVRLWHPQHGLLWPHLATCTPRCTTHSTASFCCRYTAHSARTPATHRTHARLPLFPRFATYLLPLAPLRTAHAPHFFQHGALPACAGVRQDISTQPGVSAAAVCHRHLRRGARASAAALRSSSASAYHWREGR